MALFNPDILASTEMEELLALGRSNLIQHIADQTATSQGFLTFEYTIPVIEIMMADMVQPVIKADNRLAGYALATSCDAGMAIELMRPLVALTEQLNFENKPLAEHHYYFMGQICVHEDYRGQGVFDLLYTLHKTLFAKDFDCLVTEIATANKRSLAAHKRVGFQQIHSYVDNGKSWEVVVWDWK
jgi:ribosomal protein S18 acetylase RimI-like enzyme